MRTTTSPRSSTVYSYGAHDSTEGVSLPVAWLRRKGLAGDAFGVHLIEGLYRTARSIEATARQRGSLVMLGTLVAGLAHEINNPASASSRAVDALGIAHRTLLASLGGLAHNDISAAQFSALDELRREIDSLDADPDPLGRADREQELSLWLTRRGVAREWIAPLAAAGVDAAWCEPAARAMKESRLEPALEWGASTLSAAALLGEVQESTRRITELVAAVRSYSQMDRASMQLTDLSDGLDSTLQILGSSRALVGPSCGSDSPSACPAPSLARTRVSRRTGHPQAAEPGPACRCCHWSPVIATSVGNSVSTVGPQHIGIVVLGDVVDVPQSRGADLWGACVVPS